MATIATEIKDMKSWDEAEYWLTTHGWGPELIAQQKEAWDAAATPAPAPKPAPVAAPAVKAEVTKSTKKANIKKQGMKKWTDMKRGLGVTLT